jgi:hypothetical protein
VHDRQHCPVRKHVDLPPLLSAIVGSGFASVDSSFAAWSSVAAAASGACSDRCKHSPHTVAGEGPTFGRRVGGRYVTPVSWLRLSDDRSFRRLSGTRRLVDSIGSIDGSGFNRCIRHCASCTVCTTRREGARTRISPSSVERDRYGQSLMADELC